MKRGVRPSGKKLIFLLPLMFLAAGTVFAVDPLADFVNVQNLPEGKAFRESLQWYRDNYQEISEAGRREISGEAVEAVSGKLLRLLGLADAEAAKNKRGLDLLLLRVLIYWDFYGFALSAEADYGSKIIAECLRIESLFPDDFRAYWLLGTFYTYGARPLESMKQFASVIDRRQPEALPARFWRSYASAAGFADMHKHAMDACRRCAVLDRDYVPEDDIVYRVANHFRTPAFTEEIPPGSLYQFQEREGGFGLLCRLFGVYVPVDKAWGNQSFEVKNNGSFLVFAPPPIVSAKNTEVSYTIIVAYDANQKTTFEDYVESALRKAKASRRVDLDLGDYPFAVYELTDPGMYRPAGGFHGLAVFLKRHEPYVKGLGIERPVVSLWNEAAREPYYRPPRAFDRYDGDIYYAVTLDCSDDIFPQAAEVFQRFVKGMLFD